MFESLYQNPISLARGTMLRIDGGPGVQVHVREGEIWLTQEGSTKDHVLQAGQSFRVDRDGLTLAHAFQPSVLSLAPPAPRVSALRAWTAKLLAPLNRPDTAAF